MKKYFKIMGISIKNISYSYKDKTLGNCLDISVKGGEFAIITGESGIGKTTLLNVIAGLKKPDHGEIYLDQKILNSESVFVEPENRNIGYVFQDFALFPHISVIKNILYASKEKKEDLLLFKKFVEALNLENHLNKMPYELSGGLMQRTAICRSLMMQPSLLLMDEPISNLDHENANAVQLLVSEYVQKRNIPCLIISHDIDQYNEIKFSKKLHIS